MRAELVVDCRAALGESPVWDDRTGVLRWIDGPAGVIHAWRPDAPDVDSLRRDTPVTAIALRSTGGLLVAHHHELALLDPEEKLCDLPLPDGQRLNDGAADRFGTYWIGSVSKHRCGHLYRVHPDGEVVTVLSGIGMSNGLDWSPAGDVMYYVDTATQRVDRFTVDVGGTLRAPRPFASVHRRHGLPDGLAVDEQGGVWLAVWGAGQVRRLERDGTISCVVDVPATHTTSCAFGGEDLRTLFITSAREGLSAEALARNPAEGGLFAVTAPVAGRPPFRFAG